MLSRSLSGSVIGEKVRPMVPVTRGFNAETDEYVDMMEAGINDPTKAERIAVRKAASIASLLLKRGAHHRPPGLRDRDSAHGIDLPPGRDRVGEATGARAVPPMRRRRAAVPYASPRSLAASSMTWRRHLKVTSSCATSSLGLGLQRR